MGKSIRYVVDNLISLSWRREFIRCTLYAGSYTQRDSPYSPDCEQYSSQKVVHRCNKRAKNTGTAGRYSFWIQNLWVV